MPTSQAKAKPADATRILLVDDHPIVRRGMAMLIEEEPGMNVCGETADAGEAMKLVASLKPHLVIVDISLGEMSGLELIKQLKARHPDLCMLVASMHDESFYAERVLRAGALGYLNKSEASEKILEAIRTVLRGKMFLSPAMTNRMLQRMVRGDDAEATSAVDSLSDRELEVFELIGQGLTTREVAERLHLSPKTIETYREHIKEKLNLKNSAELVHTAVQWVVERK